MLQLKKGLCVLALVLACVSLAFLRSGSALAAPLRSASTSPQTVSGGGCTPTSTATVCNNLDGSGNLIAKWIISSVPAGCTHAFTSMQGISGTLLDRGCFTNTFTTNFGRVRANSSFQAVLEVDFHKGKPLVIAAPPQFT
ncbi:MAG TPA: hypothetical protein VFB12_17850 [Ktedonobacteraceae bacterium]|nr:hypothetical protein [Ktedonobacteraceae bacterium]